MNCEQHNFYCMKCGRPGIPIMRKRSHLHKGFHRKKLYCPWCKVEINHVECRSQDEVFTFLENFKNGLYSEEAMQSLEFCM